MNTFAFVGDLEGSPEVSCVYHSEEAENQVGAAPAATPPPPAPHHAPQTFGWQSMQPCLPLRRGPPPLPPPAPHTHRHAMKARKQRAPCACLCRLITN